MQLGLYQFNPEWGNIKGNLETILNKLNSFDKVDLWVLPELCTTGYQFKSRKELQNFAEEFPGGQTSQAMMALTKKRQNAVVIGVAEKISGKLFNSAAIFEKGEFKGIYRKIHLFYKEKDVFDSGNEPPGIYNIMGAKTGVMICFDWIFPEISRTLALKGAELLIHPANLVLPHCQDAMITRSLENQIFTVTANRIGTEDHYGEKLTFTGMSQVTDCKGKRLGQLKADEENVLVMEIDPALAKNKKITNRNDLFKDRQTDLYNLKGEECQDH
ncbi:MAG: nitrilase-related carbon-nitrogen hydrolase [Fidelibacterota bacterium]